MDKSVKYLVSKEDLRHKWITNYKLMFQIYSQLTKYFSTILYIPKQKVINAGYQEFFVKYFFNIDKYRKFLEKVNPPYVIYNISSLELDRTKLNQQWNTDPQLFVQEFDKYFLHLQRSYLRANLNVSLYLDTREQLLLYQSYLLGTFDQPNGGFEVSYDLSEFIPDDEPQLKNQNLIFRDYIAIINPSTFEDSSEYVFDETSRTFKITFAFTIEGYVVTKIRWYSKEEGISSFIISSNEFNRTVSEKLEKSNIVLTEEITQNLNISGGQTVSLNLFEQQKQKTIFSSSQISISDLYITINEDTKISLNELLANNNLTILEITKLTPAEFIYNKNDNVYLNKEFLNIITDSIKHNNLIVDFIFKTQNDDTVVVNLNNYIENIIELLTSGEISIIEFINTFNTNGITINSLDELKQFAITNTLDNTSNTFQIFSLSKTEQNGEIIVNIEFEDELYEIVTNTITIKTIIDDETNEIKVIQIQSQKEKNIQITYNVNEFNTIYTTTMFEQEKEAIEDLQDLKNSTISKAARKSLSLNLKITKDKNKIKIREITE